MKDFIDLRTLTMDELAGVVNLYPWFGAARQELCVRMSRVGGKEWGDAQYADAAMYVVDRSIISGLAHPEGLLDYADKDVETILKSYIEVEKDKTVAETKEEPRRVVRVVGGDYFTQEQYDDIRKSSDNVFSHFAADAKKDASGDGSGDAVPDDCFCTETLAQIYAEQGYYDEAKHIYSKLILAYPEKNTYFAIQIKKLETDNNCK
jgi:tetratricopeptide (TPR) repeat protein